METNQPTDLTPEERQANIDRLIAAWKARKAQVEADSIARFHSPEYQQALAELDERNAERGTRTVKV